MKKILNPYAAINPRELLPASERNKLSQRFQLINPSKNILHVKPEESSDED